MKRKWWKGSYDVAVTHTGVPFSRSARFFADWVRFMDAMLHVVALWGRLRYLHIPVRLRSVRIEPWNCNLARSTVSFCEALSTLEVSVCLSHRRVGFNNDMHAWT